MDSDSSKTQFVDQLFKKYSSAPTPERPLEYYVELPEGERIYFNRMISYDEFESVGKQATKFMKAFGNTKSPELMAYKGKVTQETLFKVYLLYSKHTRVEAKIDGEYKEIGKASLATFIYLATESTVFAEILATYSEMNSYSSIADDVDILEEEKNF